MRLVMRGVVEGALMVVLSCWMVRYGVGRWVVMVAGGEYAVTDAGSLVIVAEAGNKARNTFKVRSFKPGNAGMSGVSLSMVNDRYLR
jgi:hypothetical protein